MGPSPEWHRDFVDALRDALGLAPLYGPDEPTPIATYPDVGSESFYQLDPWAGLPSRDGWFNQARKHRRDRGPQTSRGEER